MPVAISSPITSPPVFQHPLFDFSELEVEPEPPSIIRVARSQPPASPREIGFGILSYFCGPELIDRVLAQHGRVEKRCRLLPARLVVCATLLMCMRPDMGYQRLMHQLRTAVPASQSWTPPGRSAFAQARQRLGFEAMESMFRAQAMPLAGPKASGCWWRHRRVMAIDGTTLELANREELWEAFGGQMDGDKRQGPPLLRAVALVECGTRAFVDAEMGAYATGEKTLAERLVRSIEPGMLALADRNYPSVRLYKRYVDAGADVLWRVKKDVAVRNRESLADGSHLATIGSGKKAVRVRVIEYTIEGSDEAYRLLTNMLDPEQAPAAELAALYAERWEVEIGFREIKTSQCAGKALRSLTPDGVRQEFWANLAAYAISRRFIYQAAMTTADREPDCISFSLAQDQILSSASQPTSLKASRLAAVVRNAVQVLARHRELLTRRNRSCPRVVRYRGHRYRSRAMHQGPLSTPQPRRPPISTPEPSAGSLQDGAKRSN